MDNLKILASAIWAYVLDSIMPVNFVFYLLLITMFVDTITGYRADNVVNNASFKLSKAFSAVRRLILYLILIILVHRYFIDTGKADLATQAVNISTGWVMYWYLVNITKNASLVYPKETSFKILHQILTIDVVRYFKSKFKINDKNGDNR